MPHYFVPSDAEAAIPVAPEQLVCAIDAFDLEAPHLHPLEVAVGVTADGALGFATGTTVRERLAGGALKQLHFEEIATPPRRRTVDARQLFLFDLQLVEQVSTAPDLNDPVYLYGTLVGPIEGDHAMATKGQLTVTRADLFHGLCGARPWAFRYPSAGSSSSQCHHALLAAGRDADVAAGEGLVLAYPILAGVAGDDLENSGGVQVILDDGLSALRGDLFALDEKRGAMARLLSKGTAERLRVPPRATLDDYFALADEALRLIPGVPTERSETLFRRVRPSARGPRRASATSLPPTAEPTAMSAPSFATPSPPRARRAVEPARSNEPPKWMQDFMSARRSPAPGPAAREPSHLTWTGGKQGENPWMSDFEQAAPPPEKKPDLADPQPARKPDWMKDFE